MLVRPPAPPGPIRHPVEIAAATEAEARAALRAFDGAGGLEAWIARQAWHTGPGGWIVAGALRGWTFRLRPEPGGLRVTASAGRGAEPAVWVVPPARRP